MVRDQQGNVKGQITNKTDGTKTSFDYEIGGSTVIDTKRSDGSSQKDEFPAAGGERHTRLGVPGWVSQETQTDVHRADGTSASRNDTDYKLGPFHLDNQTTTDVRTPGSSPKTTHDLAVGLHVPTVIESNVNLTWGANLGIGGNVDVGPLGKFAAQSIHQDKTADRLGGLDVTLKAGANGFVLKGNADLLSGKGAHARLDLEGWNDPLDHSQKAAGELKLDVATLSSGLGGKARTVVDAAGNKIGSDVQVSLSVLGRGGTLGAHQHGANGITGSAGVTLPLNTELGVTLNKQDGVGGYWQTLGRGDKEQKLGDGPQPFSPPF
jgi:hypothetical protein